MRHILFVEDHLDCQFLMKYLLQDKYQLSLAFSTKEADQILKDGSVDLILMDLSLQGDEDGLSMVRRLRRSSQFKSIPILAITAHAFPVDRTNALEAGCNDFLPKPIRKEILYAKISEHLIYSAIYRMNCLKMETRVARII